MPKTVAIPIDVLPALVFAGHAMLLVIAEELESGEETPFSDEEITELGRALAVAIAALDAAVGEPVIVGRGGRA